MICKSYTTFIHKSGFFVLCSIKPFDKVERLSQLNGAKDQHTNTIRYMAVPTTDKMMQIVAKELYPIAQEAKKGKRRKEQRSIFAQQHIMRTTRKSQNKAANKWHTVFHIATPMDFYLLSSPSRPGVVIMTRTTS
jgi:hypothetical protein